MNILDLTMEPNDAEATTMRDYLKELLKAVWEKEERFSGKRPFGNSGWQFEVYGALVKGKAVEGTLDTDGYLEKVDRAAADKLIIDAIAKMV